LFRPLVRILAELHRNTRTNFHALSRIWTHDPSIWVIRPMPKMTQPLWLAL
jgi:hypothetical protein